MALGGLPVLGLLLAYHRLVTGHPLRSTYALIAVPDFTVSFAPEVIRHDLALIPYRMAEFGVWASPVLLGVHALSLLSKVLRREVAFYDLVFPQLRRPLRAVSGPRRQLLRAALLLRGVPAHAGDDPVGGTRRGGPGAALVAPAARPPCGGGRGALPSPTRLRLHASSASSSATRRDPRA
jgi:hypothetical protein